MDALHGVADGARAVLPAVEAENCRRRRAAAFGDR